MKYGLANILTIGRLVLVPFFLLFFLLEWYAPSFFVFSLASFTDLIDGTIARFFKQHSKLGAFLDPLADKLLMLATFSCLAYINTVPVWFLVLLVGRDVMIMGGVGILKLLKIDVEYRPFWSSKFATLLQIVLGALALGSLWCPLYSFGAYPITDIVEGMMYVTTLLIVITALQYIQKGIEILKERYSL